MTARLIALASVIDGQVTAEVERTFGGAVAAVELARSLALRQVTGRLDEAPEVAWPPEEAA